MSSRTAIALAIAMLAAACKREPERLATPPDEVHGNAKHGEELVAKFECARCHDGIAKADDVKPEKACVGCHERILTGLFTTASPEAIQKWTPLVQDLRYAPSLAHTERLRTQWIEGYLVKPHDLRPSLRMTMPRLAVTPEDARDIAAYLKTRDPAPAVAKLTAGPALERGNADSGKKLLGEKGCTMCHRFTGVSELAPPKNVPGLNPATLARGMSLAPDLRFARDRMAPVTMAAWIQKPSALKPGSDMPDLAISETEARDLATYIATAAIAPAEQKKLARLPVLERAVKFDEVNTKVFHRTCWHCHSEPDFAIGDGGPGNSGGFGFAPRGVDLSSFQGVMAGFFERNPAAEPARRKSLFAPTKDGTPRLLAALVARHAEENGEATGDVRGMPLGLPPLSAEDIQLVETWIAQGRQR